MDQAISIVEEFAQRSDALRVRAWVRECVVPFDEAPIDHVQIVKKLRDALPKLGLLEAHRLAKMASDKERSA